MEGLQSREPFGSFWGYTVPQGSHCPWTEHWAVPDNETIGPQDDGFAVFVASNVPANPRRLQDHSGQTWFDTGASKGRGQSLAILLHQASVLSSVTALSLSNMQSLRQCSPPDSSKLAAPAPCRPFIELPTTACSATLEMASLFQTTKSMSFVFLNCQKMPWARAPARWSARLFLGGLLETAPSTPLLRYGALS